RTRERAVQVLSRNSGSDVRGQTQARADRLQQAAREQTRGIWITQCHRWSKPAISRGDQCRRPAEARVRSRRALPQVRKPVSAADHPVLRGLPGEADARLKSLFVWIERETAVSARSGIQKTAA